MIRMKSLKLIAAGAALIAGAAAARYLAGSKETGSALPEDFEDTFDDDFEDFEDEPQEAPLSDASQEETTVTA